MSRTSRSRTAVGALVAAALLATAGASVPAFMRLQRAPARPQRRQRPRLRPGGELLRRLHRRGHRRGSGHLGSQLRTFYLTKDLRTRLAKWESREHADGVLRAQDVPRAWKVTAGDSGAGHTWSTVRLTWGSAQHPTYTYLTVQSDLATKKISDIKAKS